MIAFRSIPHDRFRASELLKAQSIPFNVSVFIPSSWLFDAWVTQRHTFGNLLGVLASLSRNIRPQSTMLLIHLLSISISTLSWHAVCAPAPQASSPAPTDPGALINALVSLSGVVSDPNGPFASNGALGANGALGPGCLANNTAALGPDGPFGVNGPFGPNGQFGPNGPFGPSGPFGPNGQVSES